LDDRTPIIIGVGEASERIEAPDYAALSPVELASRAAAAAVADAGGKGVAARIQTMAAIRQFEVSGPGAVAPFGKSDNFPRSVAKRIGADPARAILEPVGGQGPQHLVNEFAQAIGRGEMQLALICGSESISTVRHLAGKGETRDWAEAVGGQLEDRGFGPPLSSLDLRAHGLRTAMAHYALFENARRAQRGLDRTGYALEMGRLFAPFTQVASTNPHAMSQEVFDAEALATVTPRNRLVADPFPRRMVARDQANQGAAVLIASVGQARAMGVPQDRWVYLRGGADVMERMPMERQDMAAYPAAVMAARQAMQVAGVGLGDLALFDLYSCFPIAVTSVRDGLGIAADDARPLTLTGGLPFFGGAGNNYSMHAIAEVVPALRARPGAFGFIGANGGMLSKYSAGVYSTTPADWSRPEARRAKIPYDPVPGLEVDTATGEATVETYTTTTTRSGPAIVVIARLPDGRRAAANQASEAAFAELAAREPIGRRVRLETDAEGFNRFTFID
jgi:acetyl-CoA C-acetyltransferase